MLLLALLLCSLSASAGALPARTAPPSYCTDNTFFWRMDGATVPSTVDWTSPGEFASFAKGPCLGLSGIGVTQSYTKKLLIIDRSTAVNGYIPLDPVNGTGTMAFSIEVDLVGGTQRPLNIITDAFCSSGQFFEDGSFLSIGGDIAGSYTTEGKYSIRKFGPCNSGDCDYTLVDQPLARARWYPTSAQLGDGRIIIVGGSNQALGLTTPEANSPYIEYYPKSQADPEASYNVPLLDEALPYSLFPFVHVLPSGNVFIFASHKWTLWDTTSNSELGGAHPELDANDERGNPLRFTYPVAGTSAMFPVSSQTGSSVEIMICGGTGTPADQWVTVNGTTLVGTSEADLFYPASNKCFRIMPEAAEPTWTEEAMALPRVMPIAVLLPAGHLAILGGMQQGHSGFGPKAHKPALRPEIYDTSTHAWYPRPLPASKIPRGYHASSLIMHDGTVFISGSNPNNGITTGNGDFPTEFRSEFFRPPYYKPGLPFPSLKAPPTTRATYGGKLQIEFTFPGPVSQLKVVAVHPGFSTHGANHGMRNVELDVVRTVATGGMGHSATVAVPPNRSLLPPTWYWLFVVVNNFPCRDGHYIVVSGPAKV